MFAGTKLTVTPLGSPLTARVSADLNPLSAIVDTVTGTARLRRTVAFVPPSDNLMLGRPTFSVSN
jgi:hypothetical protein